MYYIVLYILYAWLMDEWISWEYLQCLLKHVLSDREQHSSVKVNMTYHEIGVFEGSEGS